MKKHLLVVLPILLSLLFFSIVENTNAQEPEPCTPDCEDTTWVNDNITVNLRGCNPNCYVKIFYSTREACGIWQDIQVTRVETLTGYCNSCSTKDLFLQAYYAVITINRMGFEPKVGESGCDNIWRATAGGCLASWQIYYHDPTHQGDTLTILQKCDDDQVPCCLKELRVCRYLRDEKPDSVTIDPLGGPPYPTYNCHGATIPSVDTLPPPPDGTECEPVCDWFDDIFFSSEKKSYAQNLTQETSTLYPNPASNIISFDINATDGGTLKSQIFTSDGKIIKTSYSNLSSGWNNIGIDIQTLNTGSYYLKTYINGNYLHTQKFVVTK